MSNAAEDAARIAVGTLAAALGPPELELAAVARLMRRFRLDSVEMPSGLKVVKSIHELRPEPDEAPKGRETEGTINALEDDDRIPLNDDEIQFAASRMPPMTLGDFAPQAPPRKEPSDGEG